MNVTHTWRARTVTLAAVALVAFASSAASAATRPDDRPLHGPGVVAVSASRDAVRPDDRATHGPGSIASITPIVAQPAPADGFDWIDAGVGAATVLGLGLLGVAASALAFRSRRRTAFP